MCSSDLAAGEDRSVSTVRISVPKLDLLLRSAEELLALRQSARKRALELREIAERVGEWDRRWAGLQAARRALSAPSGSSAAASPGDSHEVADFLDWTAAQLRATGSLVAAACSSNSDTATTGSPSASTVPVDTLPDTTVADTTTEATTTTTEAPKPTWPLTGLVADDPSLITRPAVIVKVGNYDRHPQRGTLAADIVFEEIINDRIPR